MISVKTNPPPPPFVAKPHTKIAGLKVPEDPENKYPFKESANFEEAQSNLNWALDNLAGRIHLTFPNAENVKFRMAECFGFMRQEIKDAAMTAYRVGPNIV